jgi:hypothetical protein
MKSYSRKSWVRRSVGRETVHDDRSSSKEEVETGSGEGIEEDLSRESIIEREQHLTDRDCNVLIKTVVDEQGDAAIQPGTVYQEKLHFGRSRSDT